MVFLLFSPQKLAVMRKDGGLSLGKQLRTSFAKFYDHNSIIDRTHVGIGQMVSLGKVIIMGSGNTVGFVCREIERNNGGTKKKLK